MKYFLLFLLLAAASCEHKTTKAELVEMQRITFNLMQRFQSKLANMKYFDSMGMRVDRRMREGGEIIIPDYAKRLDSLYFWEDSVVRLKMRYDSLEFEIKKF